LVEVVLLVDGSEHRPVEAVALEAAAQSLAHQRPQVALLARDHPRAAAHLVAAGTSLDLLVALLVAAALAGATSLVPAVPAVPAVEVVSEGVEALARKSRPPALSVVVAAAPSVKRRPLPLAAVVAVAVERSAAAAAAAVERSVVVVPVAVVVPLVAAAAEHLGRRRPHPLAAVPAVAASSEAVAVEPLVVVAAVVVAKCKPPKQFTSRQHHPWPRCRAQTCLRTRTRPME
jgi:hypothetical protein